MGVPVAYLKMTQTFPLNQTQVDAIKSVRSGGKVALRFLFTPTAEQFAALGTTIKAEAGPWAADIEVTHE